MRTTAIADSANPSRRRAATLVEVLTGAATVTVLVTTALAPTFTGLRERQRQAVCTSRMAGLAKALLVYAQDYDDTPPFMGLGWESIYNDTQPSDFADSTADGTGDIPTKTRWEWAVSETWISQNPQLLWNGTLPEEDWANHGAGLTTGSLFPYTRFESLYRCPEFERIAGKSQSQFNYTRSKMGRLWPIRPVNDDPNQGFFVPIPPTVTLPGPILKPPQVYGPALLPMLYDEWWWRHVGSPLEEHIPSDPYGSWYGGLISEPWAEPGTNLFGGWCAVDAMYCPLANEIGRYHGRPRGNRWLPADNWVDPAPLQQGSIACYDGHVELRRTPLAGVSDGDGQPIGFHEATAILHELLYLVHAQQGMISSSPL